MKKILLSLAVIAMAAGCSMVDEGGVPSGKNIIRVTSDEGTRTEIVTDDDVNFRHNWVEGDAIALFDAKDILKYELVGEGGSTVADFAGEAPVKQKAPYYAFYPYKDNIDIYNDATNQSKFLYNFPNEVEYDGGVMAGSNVMIGFTDEKNLSMKNACAYIRVSLSAQDLSFLDEIEIIANGGELIAGPHLVGIDADGVPFTEPCYDKADGTAAGAERSYLSNVLKVKFPETKFIYANSSVFYIPVPAVDLSEGLSFNLYGNFSGDSEINLTSSTATLERNNVLVMPDYRITINYALLTDGEHFNVALKKMVNDTVTLTGTNDKIIKKITFKVNEELEGLEGTDVSAFGDGSIIATLEGDDEIVIHAANPDIRTNVDASYMFARMQALETVEGWDLVDTKMSTNMRNMFYYAVKLTDIDLASMDTKNVTNMWSIFCAMSTFDDSFADQIVGWDVSKVEELRYAFQSTAISKTEFFFSMNFESLQNMEYCFSKCDNIVNVNWKGKSFPSTLTAINHAFYQCYNLKTVDMSDMTWPAVQTVTSLFYQDEAITSVDFSNIKADNITALNSSFRGLKSLTSVNFKNFNTEKCKNFDYMFRDCEMIEVLDLSSFKFGAYEDDFDDTFRGCKALQKLDMSAPGWDFLPDDPDGIRMRGYNMFRGGCFTIKEWKLGKDCTMPMTYYSYAWNGKDVYEFCRDNTTASPLRIICSAKAAENLLKAGNNGSIRRFLNLGTLKFISINDETTPLVVYKDGTAVTQNANGGYDVTSGYSKVTVSDPTE